MQYEQNNFSHTAKGGQANLQKELTRMTTVVQHFMANIQNYLSLQQQQQ
jgi:hypothetical protein